MVKRARDARIFCHWCSEFLVICPLKKQRNQTLKQFSRAAGTLGKVGERLEQDAGCHNKVSAAAHASSSQQATQMLSIR
jgi:hypothetical protein